MTYKQYLENSGRPVPAPSFIQQLPFTEADYNRALTWLKEHAPPEMTVRRTKYPRMFVGGAWQVEDITWFILGDLDDPLHFEHGSSSDLMVRDPAVTLGELRVALQFGNPKEWTPYPPPPAAPKPPVAEPQKPPAPVFGQKVTPGRYMFTDVDGQRWWHLGAGISPPPVGSRVFLVEPGSTVEIPAQWSEAKSPFGSVFGWEELK